MSIKVERIFVFRGRVSLLKALTVNKRQQRIPDFCSFLIYGGLKKNFHKAMAQKDGRKIDCSWKKIFLPFVDFSRFLIPIGHK